MSKFKTTEQCFCAFFILADIWMYCKSHLSNVLKAAYLFTQTSKHDTQS